ncbi:hypothetical protein PAPHI01_0818 [Pancytospora philotis]|nr:hypothetical protein PAPHI01_0818 [Pancytospora philotis]
MRAEWENKEGGGFEDMPARALEEHAADAHEGARRVSFDLDQTRVHLIAKSSQILFDDLVSTEEDDSAESGGSREEVPVAEREAEPSYTLVEECPIPEAPVRPAMQIHERPVAQTPERIVTPAPAHSTMQAPVRPASPELPAACPAPEGAAPPAYDLEIVIDEARNAEVDKINERMLRFAAVKNMFSADSRLEERVEKKIDTDFPSIKDNHFIKQDRR